MRKIYKIGKHRDFLLKKSKKISKKRETISKGSNTKQFRAYKELRKKYSNKLKYWDSERKKFYMDYYAPISFDQKIKQVMVNKQIGSETDIEYLAGIGEQLIEGRSKEVLLNIYDCQRVWPSGVMLFCSFLHWTRLRANEFSGPPKVSSTVSKHRGVSSYLDFCGFHDYVRRAKTGTPHTYNQDQIVKIKREQDGTAFSSRFDEISALIEHNTNFDEDELEEFKAIILGEILINVTEHGINYKDMGWYTLTQIHQTTGIISINIADNGIGIKNSLKTGPQKISLSEDLDHRYINEAFKIDVSGAFSASTEKKGFISKSYEKGQRRGNGLMHIRKSCKNLGIQLTIMSGKGYVQFDKNGRTTNEKSLNKTIFAGTLYNLVIPFSRD